MPGCLFSCLDAFDPKIESRFGEIDPFDDGVEQVEFQPSSSLYPMKSFHSTKSLDDVNMLRTEQGVEVETSLKMRSLSLSWLGQIKAQVR